MIPINPKVVLPALLLAILGGYIGDWADRTGNGAFQIPSVIVGAIAGAMFGLALGLYLAHQRNRWIAVATLAAFLLFVLYLGGIVSTLFTLAAICVTFIVTAGVLRDLYHGSTKDAIKNQLSVMTSIRGGFLVVTGGKIVVPTTQPPHLGPKLVIVRPGNAVVMINGGSITRICGPSVFMSKNFEYVGDVLRIDRQPKTLSISEVVTSDIDPVAVQVRYNFGINMSEKTIRGENGNIVHSDGSRGLTAEELQLLRALVTLNPKWETALQAQVESTIRGLISQCGYEQLIGANHYQRLARKILYSMADHVSALGAVVESVSVVQITPNTALLDAHIEGQRTRSLDYAKGDGFRLAITEIAQGYRLALTLAKEAEDRLGKSIGVEDIHRMATRYLMDHMAEDPATKVVLTAPIPDAQGLPTHIDDFLADGPNNGPPTARGPGARA